MSIICYKHFISLSHSDKDHDDRSASWKTLMNAVGTWSIRKKMQFLSSFYVLTTCMSLPSSHCVQHVPTYFLPLGWSCTHHVQCFLITFLLLPFRSHHVLITHLPRSHCILPDLTNTTPRTPRSHSFCKFSCVKWCKTIPQKIQKEAVEEKAKTRGELEGQEVHHQLQVLVPIAEGSAVAQW